MSHIRLPDNAIQRSSFFYPICETTKSGLHLPAIGLYWCGSGNTSTAMLHKCEALENYPSQSTHTQAVNLAAQAIDSDVNIQLIWSAILEEIKNLPYTP